MRVLGAAFNTEAMRRCAYRVAIACAVAVAGCGSGSDSDMGPVTWTLHGDPPTIVTITGGPWTLAQLAAGNPHPPSVPNQSFGYDANFKTANDGQTSPMQPYYFPFILGSGTNLQGYFDWRPKDINEALVAAHSTDGGQSWQFDQMALVLTEVLPVNQQSVNPNAGIADDGFGHATVMQIIGPTPVPTPVSGGAPTPTPGQGPAARTVLYMLDRSASTADKFGLVVYPLSEATDAEPLNGVPSDVPMFGNFTDESQVVRTTGLLNPDGILGIVPNTIPVEVLYVQKIPNGDATGSTALPAGAQCQVQPYTAPGASSPFPANHDLVHVRHALTQDGVNFTDLGVVTGLNDPTVTSYEGTRWIAPGGTILDLGGGRYGLFFSGGNCMDADSDSFHYIGYAENTNRFDVSNWTVINGINNPIVSTVSETVPVDGVMTTIPAEMPVVGPTLDSFDARTYSPSVTVLDSHTVIMTFSGYHVYTPANDLVDYRTINVVQLEASRPIPPGARTDGPSAD